jgi:hypothetical protein
MIYLAEVGTLDFFRVSDEDDDKGLVVLRYFQDAALASLVASYLTGEGIPAYTSNAYVNQLLPGVESIALYVHASDRNEALRLLTAYENGRGPMDQTPSAQEKRPVYKIVLLILILILILLMVFQIIIEKMEGQLTW